MGGQTDFMCNTSKGAIWKYISLSVLVKSFRGTKPVLLFTNEALRCIPK